MSEYSEEQTDPAKVKKQPGIQGPQPEQFTRDLGLDFLQEQVRPSPKTKTMKAKPIYVAIAALIFWALFIGIFTVGIPTMIKLIDAFTKQP